MLVIDDLTYSNLQEHALLVGSAGRSPGLSNMLEVARQVSVGDNRTKEIVGRVRASVADWKIHAKDANVTPAFTREIDASLNPPDKGERGGRNQAAYAAWQSGMER